MISETKIVQAFQLIDLDNDGVLNKYEVEQAFGQLDDEIWGQFLSECHVLEG